MLAHQTTKTGRKKKQTNHYNTCIPKKKNTRSSTKITLLGTTRHERGRRGRRGRKMKITTTTTNQVLNY
jgi:hypothetical protein